jgi:4-hydroxybenzoate polyprenyltransferase
MTERTFIGAAERSDAWRAHLLRLSAPLGERLRLGEGLLLAVNAAVLWLGPADLASALIRFAVSAAVLATAYSVNDFVDAEADRSNPKKSARLVALLLVDRAAFARVLVGVHAGLVLVAGVAVSPAAAASVAGMLLVNLVYSRWAKGTPGLDLAVVALWGGLFTAIAAAPAGVCALVGALTVLMHAFQMQVDVDVDAGNAVRTTAVAARRPLALVAGACLLVAGVVYFLLGPAAALTAAVPLAAQIGLRRPQAAWACSRAFAAVVLLLVLGGVPGAA